MGWKNHPRAVLAALLAVHVLAHIDRNMLLGFSPQVTRELALSNAQYGLLTGAVWVLSFGVMAVVLGSLADRFSRTWVMAGGILVWSACTAASGAAQDFGQMVAARFFVASGEAALVPAAISLLTEIFPDRRRGGAIGVFFMGIPLGIGFSFVLAGTLGAAEGWRTTFFLLGAVGVACALPLLLLPDRRAAVAAPAPAQRTPVRAHLRAVVATLREAPAVAPTIVGFVLVHMAFAGLAFTQLWLVRERGLDAATIARQVGMLQLAFGALGALVGGFVGDGAARRMRGGHAGFILLLLAVCGPLMLAYRFAAPGSLLFYAGMCAGFFLPLATYGPANALIQSQTPPHMRSTMTGVTMMLINLFAIAGGNLAVGAVSDRLAAGAHAAPLTAVLLATDLAALASAFFFLRAAVRGRAPLPDAPPVQAVLH
ncbi:MFS transporter [Ramlibacter aquaticus]|uniref:MFS transporter n=1 Tax=Ramlibacter aquaticus TaxID=2780094 RepID=A0ABR9SEZ7_9BURK|nr:MFS transporter [Ramlibacter aquaticus]